MNDLLELTLGTMHTLIQAKNKKYFYQVILENVGCSRMRL